MTFVWDGIGWRFMGIITRESAILYLSNFSKVEWEGEVYGSE